MAVSKFIVIGLRFGTLRSFDVEDTTYDPFDGKILDWPVDGMDDNLEMIAKISIVYNDAGIEHFGNHYVATGMPTEATLKVLVEKMELPEESDSSSSSHGDHQCCCQQWKKLEQRITTLEFDRDRKSMGVIVNSSSGRKLLLVKVCD
ncbi:ARABIDOPSIS THALIANA ER-TYPE CA2+-ATPASE 1, ER-type Ca2+-ATPase 1 [Hibiscus trionum]|uniref:ARABIDOPSIS THALIANA ER-TYPE CA2+-ATPASE 1, ER-type Ca2+-ATPase 1 n=1 Tax=Hibiscus trionum TaxID=183268 RepID=A0A9W7IJY1_HIBTR|nr:ARABIDOPSIS THALIANA ER-TYPE CA2+-ATPASE 1, ER-type Ca2+-ATPase 1 [Hibiscus trionum]